MHNNWKTLREETTARKEFAEELRARIYEKASEKERTFFEVLITKITIPTPRLQLSISRKYSFIERLKQNLTWFGQGIQRWGIVIGGTLVTTFLIVPLYTYLTVQPSIAYQETYIRGISSSIALSRHEQTLSPEENQSLQQGDIISTGNSGSAEIVFFEGSILRLDKNTQVKINLLSPHPYLFSQGGIEIELISGRLWGKTFLSPTQNSYFSIVSKNITLSPEKASFSVENKEGKEHLYVFKNSVDVELRGISIDDNMKVLGGEMIIFTPFDQYRPLNELITKTTPWIEENLARDELYTKEYLTNISQKLQEEYIIDEISQRMNSYLEQNPDPDSVQQIITDINGLLMPQKEEEISLETMENNIEENINSNTIYTPVPSQKKKSTYSSQAKVIYNKTNTPTPSLEGLQKDVENQNENTSIQEETNKEEKNAFERYAEKREQERKERIQNAATSFTEQVESFSFPESRTTQAQNILKKIPEDPESLEILEEIEKNAPHDVRLIVQQKKIELAKKNNIEIIDDIQEENLEDISEEHSVESPSPKNNSQSFYNDTTIELVKKKENHGALSPNQIITSPTPSPMITTLSEEDKTFPEESSPSPTIQEEIDKKDPEV